MQKLFRYNRFLIGFFTGLLVLSTFGALKLDFYYDLEDFFPKEEEELQFLRKYQSALESDDTYLFLAIDNKKSIFDTSFLNRLHSFTQESRNVEAVIESNSLTTLYDYLKTPLGFSRIPLIHLNDPERLPEDSTRIFADTRWKGSFISEDAQITVVFLKSVPKIPQKQAEKLVVELDSLLKKYGFDKVHIVSRAHTQATFVGLIKSEVLFFVCLSILVLLLILTLVFRRFWGVVVPLFSSVSGLLIFLGYMKVTGQPLDLMSTLFPVLILTIGMSDIIHLMNKYIEELHRGHSRKVAMSVTIKEIGFATLLTCLTTVIGFLSASLTISIVPVQQFGVNAAVGVTIAFVVSVLFTCMLLLYFNHDQLTHPRLQTQFWDKLVRKLHDVGAEYPGRVLAVTIMVLLFSAWGISRVTTNTYLLSDVPKTDKLRQDFLFFEDRLAGARPFEMAILPANDHKISDIEVLKEVEKVENYLAGRKEFGNLSATPTVYKTMNKAFNGGLLTEFKLPESQQEIDRYNRYLDQTKGDLLHALINREENIGRLSGRVKDFGSDRIKEINSGVTDWINTNIDTSVVKFKHTGVALLIDHNNDLLRQNLFQGLSLAFLTIAIVMAFLFKDFKMVVISLVPNIIPLIICGAIMGWAGIELKASTAIIFEVVFGIAVDDTIHFLTQYKLELGRGHKPRQAIYNTFMESGKAIIITSLILFAGFVILVFSTFTATYYMGVLMSFTFLSALLSDLFILPMLLRWAYKK